jgi:dihydroorotase
MAAFIIKNATIVNENSIFPGDVLIEGGRIEKIANQVSSEGAQEIDASGLYLLPGIIDDQVHFREPGLTQKATIYTEAKAAVAGGVTSFMEMPNTKPPALTQALLEEKFRIAQHTSLANFSFYLGTSNENLDEIKKPDPKKICGIKIFMGSSTGKLAVNDFSALENIFKHAPTIIATHCETDSMIKVNEEKFRRQYGDAIPMKFHPQIRNEEECFASSQLAIQLAKKHDARLHILHISTAEETMLFSGSIPLAEKKITAEACVHHLWFSSEDYEKLGPQIKCNPAIKDSSHKQKILEALLDDRIDVIATDHAPHLWNEKYSMTNDGKINYFQSPSGLPLIQHSLNLMLAFYLQKKISLEKIVQKMSHAPAELFQIKERGFIREGYFADLLLADLDANLTVSKENILYKCGWSPLDGSTLKGAVTHTFVNGRLVYEKGKFDESVNGMRLQFDR